MKKIIFLDRDGTVTQPGDHLYKLSDFKLLPGVIEALKILQKKGYDFIIVTNQATIGRGLCTEQDYFAFRNHLHAVLKKENISILAEYFCPHHPNDNCNCRKPKTGMLEQAAREFNLDLRACWMIGDNPSDIQAGKNAGCKTIHVLTGEEKQPITYADFNAENLIKAADYILSKDKNT